MTRLTILPIGEAARLPRGLCEGLFPERMKRAMAFRQQEDTLRCMAAGALTALVLGAKESELSYNPWGKPCWECGDLCFSLSHSGDYALLATDETEVGTDIEKNAPVEEAVAARVFTGEELAWMGESEARFYALWTMKESVMKLDGRGFSLPPESFSALPLLTGGTIETVFGTAYGKTATLDTCVLSVCTLHPAQDTPVRVLTAEALLETAGRSSLSEGQSSPSR